ncbi:SGNH/GDSL hydrolase family protein [Microbacterium enclense]|uniref:SGNH/GDSL hydrolase family protein n=1 Tax=Microbacterium enclense TaxID=993073 RepID=UPI003415E50C
MGNERGLRRDVGGMPVWGLIAAALVIVGCGVYTSANLPAPASADAQPSAQSSFTFAPPSEEVKRAISVIGDSNTEVDSDDFARGRIGEASWVSQLLRDGFELRGGWADGGTTSGTQADNLGVLERADLTLIMTGTNDLSQGVPFENTAANIDRIVEKAPADKVVLLAVPPRDSETDPSSDEYNSNLRRLAQDRGFEYFDGLTFLRSPDGGFVDGMSEDGVHLNREAQARYGVVVREYLAS